MMRRLRETRPDWKIVWLVGPWAMETAKCFATYADEIWPFAADEFSQHRGNPENRQSAWAQWQLGMRLRALRPRVFLSTGNENPAARYLANVSGAEVWSGIGERRPPRVRAGTATHFTPYAKERYEAEAMMGLLSPLGIEPGPTELFFPLGEEQRRWATAFLREEGIEGGRPLVLVSPGSGWSGKNWPSERFRAVADWLERERGAQVAWIGSAGEAALLGDGPLPGKKWFGRFSIPQLAAVMERAALWFGNDSGPMHLAAVVGCPTVSLWGPTEPGKWAPRAAKHRHIRRMERCPGCEYWNPAKTCFQETHACMEAISVEDAMAAVGAVLETSVLPSLGKNT
jgi:ADP-heptose:LPS heptosyltransferase